MLFVCLLPNRDISANDLKIIRDSNFLLSNMIALNIAVFEKSTWIGCF